MRLLSLRETERKSLSDPGASKLALSSLSAQSLWEKSGRLQNGVSEVCYRQFGLPYDRGLTKAKLFRLTDRKEQDFLLCPTHEEEITSLVAKNVTSYRDMPLKLYQISKETYPSPKSHCSPSLQHENIETSSGLDTGSSEGASSS